MINKYARKLENHGLCRKGEPLIGGLDAELSWTREGEEIPVLERVFQGLNINSILFAPPAEPFLSILDFLAGNAITGVRAIHPEDCETRTFLHDIPVAGDFSAEEIIAALSRRKSVYIPGRGVVTFGTVSPEQAFVTFSSVCFSGYVKFMADYYLAVRDNAPSRQGDGQDC